MMQTVCLGLLLFSLTWAAPMVQPQSEKTKQDCVEEQRITYKGHHEKHGHYIFKYVYTSPGRKNQTNIKQEEENKDNIAIHHSGKRRDQELAPKENTVQEKEEDGVSKSQNLFENRETMNEDHRIGYKENAYRPLKMPTFPESTGSRGSADGDDVVSKPHNRGEHGAALSRNNTHHGMEPEAVMDLLGEENREIRPGNVLSKIPAIGNDTKAPSKGKKNHQRDPQASNTPVKSKSTHHIQHNTDYLNPFLKLKRIPSDFEGSGYPDLQERGDNDISPFSGDEQPFKDISGKGETVGPDNADIQTEFSSLREAETVTPDAGGPDYNDIPEKAENGRNGIDTRDETAQEANTADVSLAGGSYAISGSTNFQDLPGKEGNRVDAGSQNAHQGKVEFHYPHVPSKGQRKEGSSDVAASTNYNEIPKDGRGSSRKGADHSDRNQVTSDEKQRFPSKGKSPGHFIPSSGLGNDFKNEISVYSGPNREGTATTHNGKNYVPHRQSNSTWNKGMPQRKGSWGYRKSHSNRRFRPPKKHYSSDSDSSSESDGD